MTQPKTDWKAIALLYEEGASDVEVAKALNITETGFYSLVEENPAFATFVEKGRTMAKAWWYEQARTGIYAHKFNTTLFNFVLKNRYNWADKLDTNDTTDKDPVSLDQMRGQLQSALKQISKKHPDLLSGVNLYPKEEH